MFLWFAQPQTTDYQALYGVNSDLNSHLGLIKQWGGGTHTVCAGGGTKRGWMFSVEHLPTPLVTDIFHLVRMVWWVQGWKLGMADCSSSNVLSYSWAEGA